METPESNGGRLDSVALLLALALFLFASPFTDWWAGAGFPWYFPFALWGLLIALVGLRQHLMEGDDDA